MVDILHHFLALIDVEVGFERVLFLHKESRQNLVHVNSRDIVIVLLIDEVNEVHSLMVETEKPQPFLEVQVLFFYLFDEEGKEVLHLLLKLKHLRDLRVGVLANNVL